MSGFVNIMSGLSQKGVDFTLIEYILARTEHAERIREAKEITKNNKNAQKASKHNSKHK